MANWVWMCAATLLLLLGLALAFLGGRSRPTGIASGALVFIFFVLASMYFAANRFTGHGIDQAVLFHTAYGLDGAGFAEYAALMAATVLLVLVGGAAAFGVARFLLRSQPRIRALYARRAAVPVALLACAVNPASRDLVRVFGITDALASFSGAPKRSADFQRYYRFPALSGEPAQRRNLVYIYAEGFERTYLDSTLFPGLTPGLRALDEASISFTNVGQVPGTSFTMGGMVGSQCGIPLVTSSGGNSMSGMTRFLPNAVCMGDLLTRRGYSLAFVGGASLRFAGKGKFLSAHGFTDIQGREELLPRQSDPRYRTAWGVYDDAMLDVAYQKFDELSAAGKPFGLFLLTLDTHAPDGHLSNPVKNVRYDSGNISILNAVAGSDQLISAFIQRLMASPHAKDTLIVLASDHLAMETGASDQLAQRERRNLFLIIDPANPSSAKIDKAGTNLDVGPTVLHALGYRAQLGLGRDLLGSEPSLAEEVPDLRARLGDWRAELSAFWGVSQLSDISVRPRDKEIDAGGTTIGAPALIMFDADMNAEVFFEHSNPKLLPDYLYDMQFGQAFLLVDDCSRTWPYAELAPTDGRSLGFCVMAGRRGAVPIIHQRVSDTLEISDDQLSAVIDSPVDRELYAEQTRRLGESQLPSGLEALVPSLSSNNLFLTPSGRTKPYIDSFIRRPEVAARGIAWTPALPVASEFYFATPSLRLVKKSGAFRWRRLMLGPDLVTLLREHEPDISVLSVRGEARARLSKGALSYLAGRGLDLRPLQRGGSFAAVLDGERVVAQAIDNGAAVVLESAALRELGIDRVESAGRAFGNRSQVMVGGKQIGKNGRGLNLVFFGREGLRSSVVIDTHVTENLPADVFKATPDL